MACTLRLVGPLLACALAAPTDLHAADWPSIADAISTYTIPAEATVRAIDLRHEGAAAYWHEQGCPALVAGGAAWAGQHLLTSPRPGGHPGNGLPSMHAALAFSQVPWRGSRKPGRRFSVELPLAIVVGLLRTNLGANQHTWEQVAAGVGTGVAAWAVCSADWSF